MKLRARFFFLIAAVFLAFIAIAWRYSNYLMTHINEGWGTRFAEKQVQFDTQRTLLPLLREIALARKMAAEPAIIEMALHDEDPIVTNKALQVLESYRQKFQDHSYFAAILKSGHYYFNDAENKFDGKQLRYTLSKNSANDQWFYSTIDSKLDYQVNVDPDVHLGTTKVWINVALKHNNEIIGLIGTGLDITQFIKESVNVAQEGIRNLFVDRDLAIQLYHDPKLIDFASITKKPDQRNKVDVILTNPNDIERLRTVMRELEKSPEKVSTLWVDFEGGKQLLGVAYLPEIGWFDLTLMDDRALRFKSDLNILPWLILLLSAALFAIGLVLHRLVLKPIALLSKSVKKVQQGDYETTPPIVGRGELEDLSTQFRTMVEMIRDNSQQLEGQVEQRTMQLSQELAERKRIEVALKESEGNYKELIENVNAIILRMSLDGRVTYFNEFAEQFFGFTANEILGQHVVGTIVPTTESNTGRDLSAMIANILANPEQYADNVNENVTRDGRRVIVRWANRVILDANGKPSGVLSIGTDITAQKQAESVLIQAKETAENFAQSKSEFLANMSHEIRTPMNAIIGLSQLALNQQVPDELRDYLDKINSSSESLLGILNDILDFSKLEAGKFAIENAPFNLLKVQDTLRNLFSTRAEQKGLALHVAVDPDVPADLIGDALRLQQILSNLLGNAIKFTEHGEVKLEIKCLSLDNAHARLRFCVSDTGIGMRQESIDKLFQPFSQADSSITRRFGGTGLGLAISHGLLQLMGCEFDVESQIGQGTRFCFELNMEVAPHSTSQEVDHRHDARKAGTLGDALRNQGQPLKGLRILVAEDNRINQTVVKEFLKLSGTEVDIANNGVEALEYLRDNTYDAVLMDAHMPEMGGVEATEIIRKQPQFTSLPIIALTAGVTEEERANCLSCGMNDFVAKPIRPEELIETLIRWVHKKS